MGMILDRKYKCPVCSNEWRTLKDMFNILITTKVNCSNCDARLRFTNRTVYLSSFLSYFLSTFIASYFKDNIHPLVITILGGSIGMWLYLTFFGELVEYIPEEPVFDFNKFLDGLRNETSKK